MLHRHGPWAVLSFEQGLTILFRRVLGRQFGVNSELSEYGADVHGVRQMIIYAVKGLGSYARHARLLGEWDDSIGAFVSEVKVSALAETNRSLNLHVSTAAYFSASAPTLQGCFPPRTPFGHI